MDEQHVPTGRHVHEQGAARRVPRALALAAVGGALALGLAACGGGTGSGSDPTTPPPDGAVSSTPAPTTSDPTAPGPTVPAATAAPSDVAAALTIELDETGSGSVTTTTLTCGPDGGDHPDPAGACAALAAAGGASAFAPVGDGVMCTELYGGPQRATVTGTVDGASVRADFSRTNGCEIDRWDALAVLLGSVGGM